MHRTLLSCFALFLWVGANACDGCISVKPPPIDYYPSPPPTELVALAKQDIAQKDYAAAVSKCLKAEEMDDSFDEAKYCVLAAQVGALVQSLSASICLVACRLNAPLAYAPQAFNVKSIISSILSDIEGQMHDIDLYSYKLAKMDNPHFHIDDFPISLDPKDLLVLVNSSQITVKGELTLNLKGTWDKSEAQGLGSAINAVQGVLDYLLAHKLILDSTDISFTTTGSVAAFLANNPNLLVADPADADRIKGDAQKHKGLKNDVLAALSLLVGRDNTVELVAPANGGLKDAIKNSANESGTYTDQVVKWIDKDHDGIPEQVGVPAINALRSSILDADGKPLITKDTFVNPLEKETWKALIRFGVAVRDQLEKGGAAVGLKAPLQAIVDDLRTSTDTRVTDVRLLGADVPDLLAINPHAFLKSPKYISELLPYYYAYNTTADTAKRVFDLAMEEERWDDSKAGSHLVVAGFASSATAADWSHFEYPASGTFYVTPVTTMANFAFEDFFTTPGTIVADAVKANRQTPRLYYIALQDPSMGGLLEGDPNFNGAYGPIDSAKFNKGLNKLLKHFCLDFNVTSGQAGSSFWDAFDDSVYPAGNKIADCAAHQ